LLLSGLGTLDERQCLVHSGQELLFVAQDLEDVWDGLLKNHASDLSCVEVVLLRNDGVHEVSEHALALVVAGQLVEFLEVDHDGGHQLDWGHLGVHFANDWLGLGLSWEAWELLLFLSKVLVGRSLLLGVVMWLSLSVVFVLG
jgi:hypothetical protein